MAALLASKVCKTAASSFFNKDAAKLQAVLANTNVIDIKSCQGFKLLSASSDTKLGDALRQMAARNVSSSAFAGHPSRSARRLPSDSSIARAARRSSSRLRTPLLNRTFSCRCPASLCLTRRTRTNSLAWWTPRGF